MSRVRNKKESKRSIAMQSKVVDKSGNAEVPMASLMGAAADDKNLVAAAKHGDREAFSILVKRHEHRIFIAALRVTGNHEDAEDAAQQSFQKAFTHLHRFEEKSAFSTWVTRIAINEALMLLRKGRGLREISLDDSQGSEEVAPALEIPDSAPGPEISYSERERQQLLSVAMKQLGPNARKAVELRDLSELSVEETARAMGLSISAVKARVFHARRKLRKAMKRNLRSAWNSGKQARWTTTPPKNVLHHRLAYHAAGD
jgi:RNA polymerase sigma-70 factor, ECF subfamily